ncbi:MAG: hypothetical protein JXR91_09935 [Deltaproteobacteria bacterium]|nr:hypothetical protein [Deltaproteobacteria bacterium]
MICNQNLRTALFVVFFAFAGCGDVVAVAVVEGYDSSGKTSGDTSGVSSDFSDSDTTDSETVSLPTCLGRVFDQEGDLLFDAADSGGWIVTGWKIWRNGYLEGTHEFAGEVSLEVVAYGESLDTTWPHMTLYVDDVQVGEQIVDVTQWTNYEYSISPRLGAGTVRVEMDNNAGDTTGDVNLILKSVTLVCPMP